MVSSLDRTCMDLNWLEVLIRHLDWMSDVWTSWPDVYICMDFDFLQIAFSPERWKVEDKCCQQEPWPKYPSWPHDSWQHTRWARLTHFDKTFPINWKHCSCWRRSRKILCRFGFLLWMEGWKLFARLVGDISTQVLLHDPVEFAEVNRKGIFVDIGKEVKTDHRKKCFLFLRCRLRCRP